MTLTKNDRNLFIFCIVIVVCCFVLIACFSGVQFEEKKFKTLLIMIVLVLVINAVVLDSIRFILHALIHAFRKTVPNEDFDNEPHHQPSRSDFLRMRIEGLKEELRLPPEHRNESQNVFYKAICHDAWLYFRYFVLLLLVIVGSRDPLAFYNTTVIKSILTDNKSYGSFGTKNIKTIEDVYTFAKITLVEALSDGRNYNNEPIEESGWIHREIAKLLGVVRLRQVRYSSNKKDFKSEDEVKFAEQKFWPGWKPADGPMHYIDAYWRIYKPWMPMSPSASHSLLLSDTLTGDMHSYPEHNGYVVLLARNKQNGLRIIDFLQKYHWIDDKTAAIFIDFTLYNTDSNMFSIVNIRVEKTPFGGVTTDVDVVCAALLFNVYELSYWGILVIVLYLLQWINLCKELVVKAWNKPKSLLSTWNIIDFIIIVLNITLAVMIYAQEWHVTRLLESFESSYKLEFVDFRVPARLHQLTLLFAALLIALSTMRVWKTLYFYRGFLLFTKTLSIASKGLTSTSLLIVFFLCAFCISSFIANSDYVASFSKLSKSFTSALSLSFGFRSEAKSEDLNYGGELLGFLLYMSLMIAIPIVLINFFTTLLTQYYNRANSAIDEEREKGSWPHLKFTAFLRMEYRNVWQFLSHIVSKFRKSKARQLTVTESIEEALNEIEASAAEGHDVEDRQPKDLEKIRLIALIINAQLELMSRELQKLDVEIDSDEEKKEEMDVNIKAKRKKTD